MAVIATIVSITYTPPTSTNLDTATSTTTDSFGHTITTTTYTDASGRPTTASNKGYASVRKTEEDGRAILEEYLDETGEPVLLSSGYSAISRTYTDGLKTRIDYLDTAGEPAVISSGYSSIRRTYNEQGLADTDTYWIGNEQVCRKQGYWELHRFYDDEGQIIRLEYRGQNGEPVKNSSGYAFLTRSYNDQGKISEEKYYLPDGSPAVRSLGQSGYSAVYDEKGRITEKVYLGTDGEPVNTTKGYATIRIEYTGQGKKTLYYDVNGNPVTIGQNQYGILRASGQSIYLDEDGEEMIRLDNILNTRPVLVLAAGAVMTLLALFVRGRMRIIFLACYLLFILYMTMAWREAGGSRAALELFRTYRRFFSSAGTRQQIINNIWLFIPFGVIVFRLSHSFPRTVLICLLLSVAIEAVQYFTGIGLAEADDVLSNTIGGAIGAVIGTSGKVLVERQKPSPCSTGSDDKTTEA